MGVQEFSWDTVFEGKLIVILNNEEETRVILPEASSLCVFVMQAIRVLKSQFFSGREVKRFWQITDFSPEKRVLKIQEVKT